MVWRSVAIGSKTRGKKEGEKNCDNYRQEANSAIRKHKKDGKIKVDGAS